MGAMLVCRVKERAYFLQQIIIKIKGKLNTVTVDAGFVIKTTIKFYSTFSILGSRVAL